MIRSLADGQLVPESYNPEPCCTKQDVSSTVEDDGTQSLSVRYFPSQEVLLFVEDDIISLLRTTAV